MGCCFSRITLRIVDLDEVNTAAYPVEVFNVDEESLGFAADGDEYMDLWNADPDNAAIGQIVSFGGMGVVIELTEPGPVVPDFHVYGVMQEAAECAEPTGLEVLTTGSNTVVSWDDVDDAAWHYHLTGPGSYDVNGDETTNSTNFASLPDGDYTFTLKRICGEEESTLVTFPFSVVDGVATSLVQLMFEGDSITASTNPDNYPFQMEAALASEPQYVGFENYGTNGHGIGTGSNSTDMLSTTQINQVLAGRVAGRTYITFLYAGINDIQGGENAATVYSRLTALHLAYNTTNPGKTVAFTLMGGRHISNAGDHANNWVQIELLNDMIRAGYQTDLKAAVLIDLQTDPQLGGFNAPLNKRWFADGLHPNAAGSGRMAQMVIDALPIALGGTPSIFSYTPTLQSNVAVPFQETNSGLITDISNVIAAVPTGSPTTFGVAYGGSWLKLPQGTNGYVEVEVDGTDTYGAIAFCESFADGKLQTAPRLLFAAYFLAAGSPISVQDGNSPGQLSPSGGPTLATGDKVKIQAEARTTGSPVFKLYHRTSAGSYGAAVYTFTNTTNHDLYIGCDIPGGKIIKHPKAGGVTDN